MAAKSCKISQTRWDEHKDTILNLYLDCDLSLDKLVETMDHDHGFTATTSQFEAQLRGWKARKNLKKYEWEEVLKTIDNLASRDVKSRVLISDRLVSTSKIDRARRYCQGNDRSRKRLRVETDLHNAENNGNPSDAVIEIQDPRGQWSRYTAPVDEDATLSRHQTRSNEAHDLSTQEQLAEHSNDRTGHIHDGSESYRYCENIDPLRLGPLSPRLQPFYTPDLMSDNWLTASGNGDASVQSMDFSFVRDGAQVPQPFVQYEPYADNTFPSLELVASPLRLTDLVQSLPATMYLNNLPFERFECDLALKRLQLATCPSPRQESRLFSGVQRLAYMFATDAATIMTEANGKSFCENFKRAGMRLQTLDSILPRVQKGDGSNSMAVPPQMTMEVELHRLLLYSSANGFMGLDDIPIETVFRFLNQNSNVTSLLTRLFRDNPSYVVKGLAENLFRAAIESGDHNTTRFFLQTGLVDVNKTVYFVDGEKYTPLERAAELQRLGVVKELLRFNPEVNRTFFSRIDSHVPTEGALGLLIIGICPEDITERNHSPFSSEYLEVVDFLIDAGVRIHGSSIYRALRKFVRMDLAKKLLCKLAPSDHSEALYKSLGPSNLQCIVEELPDKEATEAITKILSDCEQTGCKQCLSLSDHPAKTLLNRTIVVGAKRGYIQLVRSLFHYAKSPTQILSAAIKSRNHELVEFVLAQKPDVRRAPPENISESDGKIQYTTPLAEAIDAGDVALIRILESEGALEHLDIHAGSNWSITQFSLAVTAASKVGDIEYMRKLLLHHPEVDGLEMEEALLDAIIYRRECVVRLLLDVRADFHSANKESLMIEAYKWGNQEILADLMSTFPDIYINFIKHRHPIDDGLFIKTLEPGDADMGLFEHFYQSGRLTRSTLTRCLAIAVKRNDSAMLYRLLESGADAMDDLALESAADGHTDMLRVLLEHIPPTKMPIRSFGIGAVNKALRQHPSNIEALELLLACPAIDFRS